MKSIYLLFLFFLLSTCTIRLEAPNQKAPKKCNVCKTFLKEEKIYDTSYKEYDKGLQDGYFEPFSKENYDSLQVKRKGNFMDIEDYEYLSKHKFCFNGMKNSEVEKKFGKSLNKYSGIRVSKAGNYGWETSYNFLVGGPDKDGNIVLDLASMYIEYKIIDGDTLNRLLPSDLDLLKKCLDEEGVKYTE